MPNRKANRIIKSCTLVSTATFPYENLDFSDFPLELTERFRFQLRCTPPLNYFKNCLLNETLDKLGCPELHKSILQGDVTKVESLLTSGADVDERFLRFFNATPLQIAVDCNHRHQVAVVDVLLKFGADVNAVDQNENSALHIALMRTCREPIVHMLIDSGCDVNLQASDYRTPLSYACFYWNFNAASKLLLSGATDETIDCDGNTLLMRLLIKKRFEAFNFLIKQNICTHITKRSDNNTLLHLAISNAPWETIDLIVKFGIELYAFNNSNHQALHIACRKGAFFNSQYLFDCYKDFQSLMTFIKNYQFSDGNKVIQPIIKKLYWFNVAKQFALYTPMTLNDLPTLIKTEDNNLKVVHEEFIEEVEKLKITLIGETSITLYNFLTKDINEIVKLLENDSVVQYLSKYYGVYMPIPYYNVDYYYSKHWNSKARCQLTRSKVPYYHGNIYCQFQLGLARKSIIDKCKRLAIDYCFNRLPLPCVEVILFQLSNNDLTAFIEAVEQHD